MNGFALQRHIYRHPPIQFFVSWVGGCLFGSLAAVVADDLVDLYDDVLGDAGFYGSAIDHLGEK